MMTSVNDKTLKTCLYVDVIGNIFIPLISGSKDADSAG